MTWLSSSLPIAASCMKGNPKIEFCPELLSKEAQEQRGNVAIMEFSVKKHSPVTRSSLFPLSWGVLIFIKCQHASPTILMCTQYLRYKHTVLCTVKIIAVITMTLLRFSLVSLEVKPDCFVVVL